jgi:hypothetical protein
MMANRISTDELQERLRESGETAAQIAGKLRAILDDPRITPEKLDELLSAINTRCAEVEDLRLSIDRTTATDVMKRVAHQVEDLWREMAKLVATRAKTGRG